MMNSSKTKPSSPKNFKEAVNGWVFGKGLETAIQNRPTVSDYQNSLSSTEINKGGFGGWEDSQKIRFSFVVPTYNSAKTLKETFESILSLGIKVEIIVVDGVSTDDTISIVKDFKDQISCWISEPDKSMYDAINKGISLVTGNVIKILNSDDRLTPYSLISALKFFEANGFNSCLRGPIVRISNESGVELEVCGMHSKARTTPDFFPILHPSWYVPAAIYREHGLYLPYFKISGDQEYLFHLNRMGVGFAYSDEPLVEFRAGGMSAGYSGLYEGAELNSHYLGRVHSAVIGSEFVIKKVRYRALERLIGIEKAEKVWQFLKVKLKRSPN